MYFLANTVEYDGAYAGEAPQLTTPYAQYDNGNTVFNFYDNFLGTTISPIWTPYGGGVSVNNGVTITGTGGAKSTYSPALPTVIDTLSRVYYYYTGFGIGNFPTSGVTAYTYDDWGILRQPYQGEGGGPYSGGATYLLSLFIGSSAESISTSYVVQFSLPYGGVTTSPIEIISGNGQSPFYQWIRDRTAPPDGVMPTTSFGSISH